jgi:hypothetical protein
MNKSDELLSTKPILHGVIIKAKQLRSASINGVATTNRVDCVQTCNMPDVLEWMEAPNIEALSMARCSGIVRNIIVCSRMLCLWVLVFCN